MPPEMPEQGKLLNKEEFSEAVANGVQRWMDRKFAEFGKWSLGAIGAAALGALASWYFTHGK